MESKIQIVGYEQDGSCEHCGRKLKHCIRVSDGRLVGATCFDKKLTAPRVRDGKKYRFGSSHIVHVAKVVQFAPVAKWGNYGVGESSTIFEVA